MNVARSVAEVSSRHAKLTLECIDRMYLNVYVPLLQTGAVRRTSSARSGGGRCRRLP